MIKLRKIKVMSLFDAVNLFPHSSILATGEMILRDDVNNDHSGVVGRGHFGKTYLVDVSDADSYLIIGEYDTNPNRRLNKFMYMGKMEYIPKVICTIHKEWELQE